MQDNTPKDHASVRPWRTIRRRLSRMTGLGFTGGGYGAGMVYVAGKPDHKMDNAPMLHHIVGLVEAKGLDPSQKPEPAE